ISHRCSMARSEYEAEITGARSRSTSANRGALNSANPQRLFRALANLGAFRQLCRYRQVKGPILRGLLRDVVNFYDERFGVGFTSDRKQDLINLLNAL